MEEAYALLANKNYKRCIAVCNRYIRANPEGAYVAWGCMGACYRDLGKYQDAVDSLTKAIELKDDYWLFYTQRGDVYSRLLAWKCAYKDYFRAYELEPERAQVIKNLIHVLYRLGDADDAITLANRIVKSSGDKDSFCLLIFLLCRAEQMKAAYKMVKRAEKKYPDNTSFMYFYKLGIGHEDRTIQ